MVSKTFLEDSLQCQSFIMQNPIEVNVIVQITYTVYVLRFSAKSSAHSIGKLRKVAFKLTRLFTFLLFTK